jgi:hypothetical protein
MLVDSRVALEADRVTAVVPRSSGENFGHS